MATLTNKTIASTYTSLLKLEGDTGSTVAGASGNAVQVKTGDNDATPLYLNTNRLGIGGQPNAKLDISDRKIETSVSDNLRKEHEFGLSDFHAYEIFADKVKKSKENLVLTLKEFKTQGKKIISYGATYKSATIFNYCDIGTDLIDYVTDTTENKQGKYTDNEIYKNVERHLNRINTAIAAAAGVAQMGDTIKVRSGVYYENIL